MICARATYATHARTDGNVHARIQFVVWKSWGSPNKQAHLKFGKHDVPKLVSAIAKILARRSGNVHNTSLT